MAYTEKDITLPTKGRKLYNDVKLKGKIIGTWEVGFNGCFFTPDAASELYGFEAKSIYSLKCQLLEQLNKPTQPPVRTNLPGDPPTGKKQDPDVF